MPLTFPWPKGQSRQAGTWDTLLQRFHLDKHLLKQQKRKKLKISARMRSWDKLGTIRYKKVKTQLPLLGCRSKSRVLCMILAHSTTKCVGRPPKSPVWPEPCIHRYPHPT